MQKYLGFIEQCVKALQGGVQVTRLCVEAAGCQAAIIDYAFEQNIAFAVRAWLSRGLHEQIRRLPVSRWQPRMNRAGAALSTSTLDYTPAFVFVSFFYDEVVA